MKLHDRVAVYTSPGGVPQRQVGYVIGLPVGVPAKVAVRFPGDERTYLFHSKQVRRIKTKGYMWIPKKWTQFQITRLSVDGNDWLREPPGPSIGLYRPCEEFIKVKVVR